MTRKLTTALLAILVIFFANFTSEAKAATPQEIKNIIVKTAISMGVDPCVALSIAKQESKFQEHKKSASGAVGVYQLMPSTARRMGLNPYNLNDNIKGGIMYYQMMYKKYGSMEMALAAYNAGPGNVAKYKGIPPFSETRRFINSIISDYKTFQNDPLVLQHTLGEMKVIDSEPVTAPLPTDVIGTVQI